MTLAHGLNRPHSA